MTKYILILVLALGVGCIPNFTMEMEAVYPVPANKYTDVLLDYKLNYVVFCSLERVWWEDRYGHLDVMSSPMSFDEELLFYQDVQAYSEEVCF